MEPGAVFQLDDKHLVLLLLLLVFLILLSGFFAGSETALMALNRYRLRHLSQSGDRGAQLAEKLLERPDRLIGMILLGNIAVHSAATAITTYITLELFGNPWIALSTGILTIFILIFGEIAPKTLSALYPERVALPAARLYSVLQWVVYPIVRAVNLLSNGVLRLFGVTAEDTAEHSLSTDELRSVVAEAGTMMPQRHQLMLLSILDLERATVEDIMVPRNEIVGIDISEPWEQVRESIVASSHTRMPVFDGSIDDLKGVVHLRKLVRVAAQGQLRLDTLLSLVRDPYYIPEGTPLNQQLLNFQDQKRRIGFVVDEYGDIQGLVTLEDILEEVVGEFTSDPATRVKNVYLDADGSALVHGSVTIRTLNRSLGWKLPTGGPKTLNGLVMEQLQELPKPGRTLEISDYRIEITDMRANAIKTARIRPMGLSAPLAIAST
jgi:Mg2+/Co2+ transporter CorB